MPPLELDLGPLLPEHVSEIIAGIVLILIIWVVVAKMVVPKFEQTYALRTEEIRGGIEKAEKAQQDAAAALQEYQAQLAAGREEAARIREEARSQGAAIIAEMRQQAADESARLLAAAQAQIDTERVQAMKQLRNEIGGLAVELAERIVGESLADDARVNNTVDRFLGELEAQIA